VNAKTNLTAVVCCRFVMLLIIMTLQYQDINVTVHCYNEIISCNFSFCKYNADYLAASEVQVICLQTGSCNLSSAVAVCMQLNPSLK